MKRGNGFIDTSLQHRYRRSKQQTGAHKSRKINMMNTEREEKSGRGKRTRKSPRYVVCQAQLQAKDAGELAVISNTKNTPF